MEDTLGGLPVRFLTEHDWENMCLGNEARQNELLYSILSNSIIDLQNSLAHDELSALAWLIADNIIDFKLALPRNQLSGEFTINLEYLRM